MRFIRRNALSLVVAFMAISLVLSAWALVGQRDANTAIATNQARDVRVWCPILNREAHVLKSYVARFPDVPPLHLPELDCTTLIHAALRSAH